MTLYIAFEPNVTGEKEVFVNSDLVDGITILKDGTSLGEPSETPMYSQTIDSAGVRVTGATKEAREQQLAFLVEGDTVAELQERLNRFSKVAELITYRGGGTFYYRSASGSKITRFKVAHCKVMNLGDIVEYESCYQMRIKVGTLVDPNGYAMPLDIYDDFSTNTLGTGGLTNIGGSDWTLAVGTASPAVTGGALVTQATSGAHVLLRDGNEYGDVQVTAKVRFDTSAPVNKTADIILKYVDASNYLFARILASGAGAGTAQVISKVAGVDTTVSTVAVTTAAIGSWYWLRARLEGNVVSVEWFATEPTPLLAPTHSDTDSLSTAQAALFGIGIETKVGLGWSTTGSNTVSFDEFRVEAFAYRAKYFPAVLRLNGLDGQGTTDAKAGVFFTTDTSTYTETVPYSMLLSWWEKPVPHNYIWNDSGEVSDDSTAYGWFTNTNTLGGGTSPTSVSRTVISGPLNAYGLATLQAVIPAGTNIGPQFLMYRRSGFRRGVTYTASVWVKSASHTSNIRLAVGASGADMATSSTVALTTSYQKLTATWTPASDSDYAIFSPQITTGGGTFQFYKCMFYEGSVEPTFLPGGYGPGIIPASGMGPFTQAQWQTSSVWPTNANNLSGYRADKSGAFGSNGNVSFLVLPHLFPTDEFSNGEVDIAIFARMEIPSTQTDLKATVSLQHELGSTYSSFKYSEFYSNGKKLILPSGTAYKPYYLGTLTAKADKRNPSRILVNIKFENGAGASGNVKLDYFILCPARKMASSMTGVTLANGSQFVRSTREIQKFIQDDLQVFTAAPLQLPQNRRGLFADQSLTLNRIKLPNKDSELLIMPSSQIIDMQDAASSNNMTKGNTATVQVVVEPSVHLLDQ